MPKPITPVADDGMSLVNTATAEMPEENAQNLKELIARYKDGGLNIIPIPYKSKTPKISWKRYQKEKPTDGQLRAWFAVQPTNLAVICGGISGGLVVLDFDNEEKYRDFYINASKKTGTDLLEFTRISKTSRGYHVWLKVAEPVKSQKYPALDIKSEGGYVIAPPSVHPEGAVYRFLNPETPIRKINTLCELGIDTPSRPPDRQNPVGNQPNWVTRALAGVAEGARSDTAIRLAGYFRNTLPHDVTNTLLQDWNQKNRPPLPESQVISAISSAYRYPEHRPMGNGYLYNHSSTVELDTERDKSVTENVTIDPVLQYDRDAALAQKIEEWVKGTTGWFSYEELDRELGVCSNADKDNRRQIVSRLKKKGVVEPHHRDNKLCRFINTQVRLIDFKSATNRTPLDLKLPFGLERLVKIYPKSIIVIAGAANAGKTGLLLNFIRLNQHNFTIYYRSSEMGEEELASRLKQFDGISLDEWNFISEECSSNVADNIRPDVINIIDYLELSENFYIVAEHFKKIHDKLGNGVCFVALQKKRGAPLGRGGDFGLEKPKLYLTMDPGICTIQKAKSWVNPKNNPNGMATNFRIENGCNFIVIKDWYMEKSE